MKLWDTQTGELVRSLEGHWDQVWSVALSADGRTLVSGSSDKKVKLWELGSGRTVTGIVTEAGVAAVGVSPDGRHVVAGDRGGHVYRFELLTAADGGEA